MSPDPTSIDVQLKNISSSLKESRSELGLMDGRGILYKKWENEAVISKHCPLCDYSFLSASDLTKFTQKAS